MKKILLFVSACFLLSHLSCLKEEEANFNYPIITIDPISDISPNGARFAGSIDFATIGEVSGFGFVWGEDATLARNTFTISADSLMGKEFFTDIRSSLIDNRMYYVRAFAKKSGKTVYSNIVSFKSLGSEGPKITSLIPALAAFGDTVQVMGRNFTQGAVLKYGNQDISSAIVNVEKNKLTFILPGSLTINPAEAFVFISIEGNSGRSPQPLTLDLDRILPKITSITPTIVRACDTVIIIGKNLTFEKRTVRVQNNLGNLLVIKASKDSIVCIVKSIPKDELYFSIDNSRFNASSQGINLTEARPEIVSVSPLIYKSKDKITIKGNNFPYCDNTLSATINGSTEIQILSRSRNEIVVQLPEGCSGNLIIVFTILGNYLNTQQFETSLLSPKPPEVYSIEPSHGSLGDEIVIKGSDLKGNAVNILDTVSTSETEIRGRLIESVFAKENGFVDVTFSDCSFLVKENGFKYDPITILDFNPKTITSQWQQITITGKNFSAAPNQNTVNIGGVIFENIVSADNRTIVVPATELIPDGSESVNQSVSITIQNGMGKQVTSSVPLLLNHEISWYRLPDFAQPSMFSGFSFSADGYGFVSNRSNSTEFWQFDPGSNSWQLRSAYPGHDAYVVSTSANGKGYVGLDFDHNNEWWEYNVATDMWSRKNDFPGSLARAAFAFEIAGKVYVGGGISNVNNYEFWEYNPATDTWMRKADVPTNSGRGTANFGFKGKGYIYGRSKDVSTYLESTYHPTTNSWTTRTIEPFDGNGNYACMVFDNYVIIGGNQLSSGSARNAFFKVVPGSGNLQPVDYAGVPRIEHVGFALDNFGYFGLGNDANTYIPSLEMWKFDPSKFR